MSTIKDLKRITLSIFNSSLQSRILFQNVGFVTIILTRCSDLFHKAISATFFSGNNVSFIQFDIFFKKVKICDFTLLMSHESFQRIGKIE